MSLCRPASGPDMPDFITAHAKGILLRRVTHCQCLVWGLVWGLVSGGAAVRRLARFADHFATLPRWPGRGPERYTPLAETGAARGAR